jgi:hypothetical protein
MKRRKNMSDRKYRQHGYQDSDRERRPGPSGDGQRRSRPAEARDPRLPRDPRVPNMPGFREVFRCTRCGHIEGLEIGSQSSCGKCGVSLRACIHCQSFDPGATFECMEKIPVRVSPKDGANSCTLFSPRRTVERETGSTAPASARKALDDLFKF